MFNLILKLLLSLQFISFSYSIQDKCHILSLDGGGDKGAYQAGAIWGVVNSTSDVEWDIITGISVGSINGAGMSIFPKGQEKNASDLVVDLWRGLTGYGDIFTSWEPYGILQGLFTKTGLFNTQPLRDLLTEIIANGTLQREFISGATNVATGLYETFDLKYLKKEDYVNAVLSSSAFPFVFPNINFKNNYYMDGAVKYSVDIPSAIQKCRDKGFPDDKIVVDVILCSAKKIDNVDATNFKSYEVLLRTVKIFLYDLSMNDLIEVSHMYPNVTLRYVVAPSKTLPDGIIPLNFNPSQIEQMISIGIEDGTQAVKLGVGKSFETIKREYFIEKAKTLLNKKEVSYEEAEELMNRMKEGKLRDYQRMKAKFLGN